MRAEAVTYKRGYRLNLLVKLAKVAAVEGRTLDDLLFEAIEEYLHTREKLWRWRATDNFVK